MSFPDPTPPPHQYISPPYPGGDAAGVWPSYWVGNDQQLQQQQQPDSMPQFDHSKKPPNFSPFSSSNPRTNPPGNKGTSHIFYKTRICAKFMEGTCRNGEHCTFAHGAEDLREPPPNWQELIREKERVAGSGGNWGDDQRIIHRMKICKKYYNGDECPYGDKCNFLHDRPSPPLKKFKADMPGQRECSAISIGTTGDGRGGSGSVEFEQAAFWKTRLCSKWEMGQCPFGERCHFAHGLSELRLSGAPDEAEVAANGGSALRKATSISAFTTPPANLVVAASANGDEDEKMKSKWKLTRRINRIYGDWLDDSSPPRCSPSGEEM